MICITKNQFKSSLRNEIGPNIVKKADNAHNRNPLMFVRRKFFAASRLLGAASPEEQQLDYEISEACSFKNVYEMSKLVEEQQEQIEL